MMGEEPVALFSYAVNRQEIIGRIKFNESERVYWAGRLFKKEENTVRQWFAAPKEIFGGDPPLTYADTEPGAHDVEKRLRRIEHGVFCC
ncbi:MAG: hypothetical protein PWQ29_1529 [Verrucomicrobiota bacterium]|jgi:uncharacterized protein (DUF2384 family)|nr:hypothetical protein [Verrucomicrobiota bacterium]MDK2964135.1 hypothetical protein [Verrucomicrobiota bacterium]